jgi:excinuclease ABC subunit A
MNHLILKKCNQNNLKNISLKLPKHCVITITGISGSGKSSLAFDTLYAEGQRRFMEYLSPDIRSRAKQMPKPDVEKIEGLSPTLSTGHHRTSFHPSATVSTQTDIYDFLAILFSKVGKQHSPATGKPLHRMPRHVIVEELLKDYPEGSRIQLLAPLTLDYESIEEAADRLYKSGFIRLLVDGREIDPENPAPGGSELEVIVDRLQMKNGIRDRLSGSVETAVELSQGILKVQEGKSGAVRYYTEIYLCPETGLKFAPLTPADFNFNSPLGACPRCRGKGSTEEGVCPDCRGGKLKPESLFCTIGGHSIHQLDKMSVEKLLETIDSWTFEGGAKNIADELLPEIASRLKLLEQVGLGYLELSRRFKTLSEGEAQRVQLASLIGARLSGILYVLDEPSRGLHPRDIGQLSTVLRNLQELGNTVIIVEHDRQIISMSDHLLEIGPGSGRGGGEVVFQGSLQKLLKDKKSLTGKWLGEPLKIPDAKKSKKQMLSVKSANCHNLNDFSVDIPLNSFVGICGVSGSGKSTLAMDVIAHQIGMWKKNGGDCPDIQGYQGIEKLSLVAQRSAGISKRSMPATYIHVMDRIRSLFAGTKLSKARGYTAARFSLNKAGGRCEVCGGLGELDVKLKLIPDISIPCEVCRGLRYNFETLQVTWKDHSIADVLEMTCEEASVFFQNMPAISQKLILMNDLGLGYLTLGQRFDTLSGGEMQRLKLISDLAAEQKEKTLYVLDEPSSGLHHHDVSKLIKILRRLAAAGHSVFVIEHNIDILVQADWLIELGPEGGPKGGKLIFEGSPSQLIKATTPTAKALTKQIAKS